MNKKILTLAALFGVAILLNAQEVSVFDAGNINNANPYGLTENEKVLLKNKQKVDSVEMTLDNTKENLEGIRTVLEGTNSQISNLENRVADLEIRVGGKVSPSGGDNSDIGQIKKDIQYLKAQIKEINAKLDGGAIKKNEAKPVNKPKPVTDNTVSKIDFTSKKTSEIMAEADSLYSKKDYKAAKERYEHLISKNYKPAKSSYMLGEISYFEQSYADAIKLYQKSISYNEGADYTPRLLYHTAISFDKIGDAQSATKFYNALKSSFPDSKEAKASPQRK